MSTQAPTTHPLSRGQARGRPLSLASFKSTTAILSRNKLLQSQGLISHSWSILLPQHGDTPKPLSPDARLVATFHGLRKARLRGLIAELDVVGLPLELAVDRLDKEIAGSQAVIKDVVDSGHSENIPQVASACTRTCRPCTIFSPSLPFVAHLGHVLT